MRIHYGRLTAVGAEHLSSFRQRYTLTVGGAALNPHLGASPITSVQLVSPRATTQLRMPMILHFFTRITLERRRRLRRDPLVP